MKIISVDDFFSRADENQQGILKEIHDSKDRERTLERVLDQLDLNDSHDLDYKTRRYGILKGIKIQREKTKSLLIRGVKAKMANIDSIYDDIFYYFGIRLSKEYVEKYSSD